MQSLRRLKYIVLFFALVGSAVADSPKTTLRVVTWNLQWFPGGKIGASKSDQDIHIAAVQQEIRKINPDILILQEVSSMSALEETLKPLGTDWKVAVVSRFMQGNFLSGQQIAIAARIQAESAWSEPWTKGWAGAPRGYSYASFLVEGRRLAVYAVHLKSNLGNPPDNTSKREDAIEQLIGHINSKDGRVAKADAWVIGGDFNTDSPDTIAGQSPGERTFEMLKKSGFDWGFDGISHGDRITCPSKGRYPPACFDHFFTKGLTRPQASVLKAEGSDHLPVVIDIVL